MTETTYINVLETLVEQEVERQLQTLSFHVRQQVRPIEVITYALNRFHPLYACSDTGVKAQRAKAKEMYGDRIEQAVTWGIRAVQQDPLRHFQPLPTEINPVEQQALNSVRELLNDPNMTWETLSQRLHQKAGRNCNTVQEYAKNLQSFDQNLSWQDYKSRRDNLANQKRHHRNSITAGAAGQLRLFS
ncbi:MAG: late competence development ComFB family protein [Prochlorotrichaceae cyanobacterium]